MGWLGVGGGAQKHQPMGRRVEGRAEFFRPDEARFAGPNLEGVLPAPAVRYLQSVAARSRSNRWTGLPAPHALPSTKLCGGLRVRQSSGRCREDGDKRCSEGGGSCWPRLSGPAGECVSARCLPANPSHYPPPTPHSSKPITSES